MSLEKHLCAELQLGTVGTDKLQSHILQSGVKVLRLMRGHLAPVRGGHIVASRGATLKVTLHVFAKVVREQIATAATHLVTLAAWPAGSNVLVHGVAMVVHAGTSTSVEGEKAIVSIISSHDIIHYH